MENEDAEARRLLAAALKGRGNEAYLAGDFACAIQLFSQSIDLDPTNHVLYSNRSAAYLTAGDTLQALRDAETCVRLAPKWTKAYHRLGVAQLSLGLVDDAIATFQQGLQLEPDNQELLAVLRNANRRAVGHASVQRHCPALPTTQLHDLPVVQVTAVATAPAVVDSYAVGGGHTIIEACAVGDTPATNARRRSESAGATAGESESPSTGDGDGESPAAGEGDEPTHKGPNYWTIGMWVGGAAVGAAVGTAAAPAVLTAAGFTALGPAAGSLAASWMSSIALAEGAGVAAGSVYATLQAAAMGNAVAAAVVGTGAAAAGAVVGTGAVVAGTVAAGAVKADIDSEAECAAGDAEAEAEGAAGDAEAEAEGVAGDAEAEAEGVAGDANVEVVDAVAVAVAVAEIENAAHTGAIG